MSWYLAIPSAVLLAARGASSAFPGIAPGLLLVGRVVLSLSQRPRQDG
ncbi:hypothetical protein ABTY59_32945 [Streptomyces sp. NPDC096079]